MIYEMSPMDEKFPFMLWHASQIEMCNHWHERMELVYIISGQTRVGINNKLFTLNQGDFLIIQSGEAHYFETDENTKTFIVFQFGLSMIESLMEIYRYRRISNPYFSSKDLENHPRILSTIDSIVKEFDQQSLGYQTMIISELSSLMVYLLRHMELTDYNMKETTQNQLTISKIYQVMDYLDNHYQEDLSVESIAEYFNYSRYHFVRFFKKMTGLTIHAYVKNKRIQLAKKMMIETQESITRIGYEVGYKQVKSFSQAFKEITGQSPTSYRAQEKGMD